MGFYSVGFQGLPVWGRHRDEVAKWSQRLVANCCSLGCSELSASGLCLQDGAWWAAEGRCWILAFVFRQFSFDFCHLFLSVSSWATSSPTCFFRRMSDSWSQISLKLSAVPKFRSLMGLWGLRRYLWCVSYYYKPSICRWMSTDQLVCFFLQLVTTEVRFLKDSLYNEGILIVWDPSVYHSDIPKVSGWPWEIGIGFPICL